MADRFPGWELSHRFDPAAVRIADRHYSRVSPGTPQFVAPGRNVVLVSPGRDAVWVSLWQRYAKHKWAGAWVCSMFRNESGYLSSEMIRAAVAATRWVWGDPPPEGMVTFVDAEKVRPKRHPGYCFRCAGFVEVGRTKDDGYVVLQLVPEDMPEPAAPLGAQLSFLTSGIGGQ